MTLPPIDKKAHILAVAESLFAEKGFEAVSVRDISKAAKINLAMVSYYFGSKENLYAAIIQSKLISPDQLRETIERYNNNREKLQALVDFMLDYYFTNKSFQNLIFREMTLQQRTGMAEEIADRIYKNFHFITEIIKSGIRKKEFKKIDPELTVLTLIGIMRMYINSGFMACKVLQTIHPDDVYLKKNKDRLKKHLLSFIENHIIH